MRRALVPAVLLSIGPVALAGDAAPDLTGSVVQTLLALGAVIALLFGTLHLLRRSGVERIEIRTDEDYVPALKAYFRSRRRRKRG